MYKKVYEMFRNNARVQVFMSVILLVAMTTIACNMDKVAELESKKEQNTGALSNGCVVVIDPGHGGADPGKVGVSGKKEKDINLEIALQLSKVLSDSGFEAVLTRDKDEVLSEGIKFSKVGDLNTRCKIINEAYAKNAKCVLVSIHQNSFTSPSVHGAQCFYYQRSEESRQLAEIFQNKLNEVINTEKPKKSKPNDSYYMLINSKCPGVILECGFLSNYEEEQKLAGEEYQIQLAKLINECLKEYFNIK